MQELIGAYQNWVSFNFFSTEVVDSYRVRLSQLSIPFGLLPFASCLLPLALSLRTGTGPVPTIAIASYLSRLPSPVSRLPLSDAINS